MATFSLISRLPYRKEKYPRNSNCRKVLIMTARVPSYKIEGMIEDEVIHTIRE